MASNIIIQNLQNKLQSRFRRLCSAQMFIFSATLRQFLFFLKSNEVFNGITEDLFLLYPNHDGFNRICGRTGSTNSEAAVIGYRILEWLSQDDGDPIGQKIAVLAHSYQWAGNSFDHLDNAKKLFLEPFNEYLDEKLENQQVMLSLMLRYKHRSEWFYRNQLWKTYNEETDNNTRKAEKSLTLDLYAYLFEQGLEFTIEPSSIDGEIDLIAAQNSDDPLLAYAKIFDSKSRNKTYICKGFNQLYTYTQQYNEPFGYLVIYKATDKDLRFSLSAASQNVPFISYNHKTIFFIVIDIYPHPKPVSQRGKLQAETITEEDLVKTITTEE